MMKKILIAEDNPVIANAYRFKLQAEGFTAEIAPEGHAALRLAETFKPDLVLLDLQLPGLSGEEVLKKLRSQPQYSAVPVIVFTQVYAPDLIEKAWKAGATSVLSKATNTPNQIVQTIRNAMQSAAQESQVKTPSTS